MAHGSKRNSLWISHWSRNLHLGLIIHGSLKLICGAAGKLFMEPGDEGLILEGAGSQDPPPPRVDATHVNSYLVDFSNDWFLCILTGKARFKCDQDGTCEISSRNLRNSCKACRLNKCQQLGMSESHFQNIQWYHFSFNFLSFFFKILNNNHLQDTWAKMEKNRVVYHIWKSKSQKKSIELSSFLSPSSFAFFFLSQLKKSHVFLPEPSISPGANPQKVHY